MQDWDPLTPAAAAQIEACPGAVYTDYLTGGYVEWYAPSVKTFVDNRQDPFPRSVVKTSSNLETNGRYASLFARYDVSCAVVTPRTKLTRSLMRGGWHSTFRSKQAEIFMHD